MLYFSIVAFHPALNILVCFAFVRAGNRVDLMDMPMTDNLLYAVYFITFSILGYFLTGPLLITVFMEEYGKHHSKSLEIKKYVRLCLSLAQLHSCLPPLFCCFSAVSLLLLLPSMCNAQYFTSTHYTRCAHVSFYEY